MEEQLLAFLKFLQQEYNYSNNTIAAYKNDLGQFVSYLQGNNSGNISGRQSKGEKEINGEVNDRKEKRDE